VGGLIGSQTRFGTLQNNATNVVSSFWLTSSATNAFGEGTQPSAYDLDSGLPVAVGVSAQTLRTISTFQSKGTGSTPFGASTGDNSLPIGNSTPGATPTANDYRWAIESGNVEGFVAQRRDASPIVDGVTVVGETVTFTPRQFDRLLWTNSDVPPATYTTEGVSETVTGYPALGRVWEICSNRGVNNGFPVLVWEERNCPSEGTGGGGTDRNREKPADTELAAALAAGLSGAELQAFLASGLTLEQWLAQRLAATGTPGEALNDGLLLAAMLSILGLWFVLSSRRLTRGRATRSSP
jgi:hypothetical protein